VLELELAADDAARLPRLAALASLRMGRPRSGTVRLVWHDTADGALARQGLSLCEDQGKWRLERLHPGTAYDWLPAAPAPVLAEWPSPEAVMAAPEVACLPGPLVPVAALNGRRKAFLLRGFASPALVVVLEGTLRGVLEDRPVCRVIFAGEARAMAELAASMSAQMVLQVPRSGLAAQAFSVAKGMLPPPRRLGAPAVPPDADVAGALGVITAHLADVILYWGSEVGSAETPEPVHQMRVAVRRLRSALSVFRRALPAKHGWLDDLAGELKSLAGLLGVARDWDVFLATTGAEVQVAFGEDRRIAAMLAAAGRRRAAAYADLRAFASAQGGWPRLALKLALLPALRPWEDDSLARLSMAAADYAHGALGRRLKHVLGAGESLDGLPLEQLHEIRKQAKRLRYAIEFFMPLFPDKAVRRYLSRLETLQEDFGTLNDSAVAGALVAGLGGGADRAFASGAVQGFGAAKVQRAIKKLQRGWAKFYRETPFWD